VLYRIVAKTSTGCVFGSSALGAKGVTAEKVAKDAVKQLVTNIRKGGCVDEHLQDQLVIFCALARGMSRFRCGPITMHTQTAMQLAQQLTSATFTVTATKDRRTPEETSYIIECNGCGLMNANISRAAQRRRNEVEAGMCQDGLDPT
jgi:RNA 3'-terminal phosphate cyclase (ATP)